MVAFCSPVECDAITTVRPINYQAKIIVLAQHTASCPVPRRSMVYCVISWWLEQTRPAIPKTWRAQVKHMEDVFRTERLHRQTLSDGTQKRSDLLISGQGTVPTMRNQDPTSEKEVVTTTALRMMAILIRT